MRLKRILPLALVSLMCAGCAANNSDETESTKEDKGSAQKTSVSEDVLSQLWVFG